MAMTVEYVAMKGNMNTGRWSDLRSNSLFRLLGESSCVSTELFIWQRKGCM